MRLSHTIVKVQPFYVMIIKLSSLRTAIAAIVAIVAIGCALNVADSYGPGVGIVAAVGVLFAILIWLYIVGGRGE
jgi:uncharacterized BrkB/YihY/UPF0761 family membrane protein